MIFLRSFQLIFRRIISNNCFSLLHLQPLFLHLALCTALQSINFCITNNRAVNIILAQFRLSHTYIVRLSRIQYLLFEFSASGYAFLDGITDFTYLFLKGFQISLGGFDLGLQRILFFPQLQGIFSRVVKYNPRQFLFKQFDLIHILLPLLHQLFHTLQFIIFRLQTFELILNRPQFRVTRQQLFLQLNQFQMLIIQMLRPRQRLLRLTQKHLRIKPRKGTHSILRKERTQIINRNMIRIFHQLLHHFHRHQRVVYVIHGGTATPAGDCPLVSVNDSSNYVGLSGVVGGVVWCELNFNLGNVLLIHDEYSNIVGAT
mmetsp:Transcript_2968/g.3270  ORF Transcript_2968/g.3270 Transcript_2968/m.3270 type:complete len:316 (+) Transcript_2968:2528-3475(+)